MSGDPSSVSGRNPISLRTEKCAAVELVPFLSSWDRDQENSAFVGQELFRQAKRRPPARYRPGSGARKRADPNMTDEGHCVVPEKWREICVHRRPRRLPMPKHVSARPPLDATEERQVRKLAQSAHAPADWIFHAKLVVRSWDGQRTRQIAQEPGCHPETVRQRLHAFTARVFDVSVSQPGSGRKPRLTQEERSTLLALVKRPPPGKPTYELTGELAAPHPQAEPEGRLDTLTAAAQQRGIQVARSQGRAI